MKRLAIQYVIFLTLAVFTAFILVLVLIAIAALNRGSSTVVSSPPQQAVTAIVTITPSVDLPTATTMPTPTASPFPNGVRPEWLPTPIPPLEALPTPQSGHGHVTGRVLCNSLPKRFHQVDLFLIEGDDLFPILREQYTDEVGRWFFGNLPPGTYGVSGKTPISRPLQLFVINADQITDFGDINLPLSLCD